MDPNSNRLHSACLCLEESRTQEELEIFGSTTLEDVHRIVAKIQSRQGIDRTLMDMTRLQPFLDRMVDLTKAIRTLSDSAKCVAFVWGPLKAVFTATSQDQKALDILLDAFEQLGNAIPDLRKHEGIFDVHPELWAILELIYQDVLQFLEQALRLSTHPNMRTLFKSMWSEYTPRFEAKLDNMKASKKVMEQVRPVTAASASVVPPVTVNVKLVAGDNYERVDISGSAQLGDTYYGSEEHATDRVFILAQLRTLKQNLGEMNRHLEAQEKQRCEERHATVREWIAAPVPYGHHESALKVHSQYPSTGLWILQHDLVVTWMKDDIPRDPILWIHGMPGAGKTILASILINACEEIKNSHTAYFYCKFDDQETHTMTGILKGILGQATNWRPDVMAYFDEQRRHGGEVNIYKEQTIRKLTEIVCRGGGQTYLVVDGIDECSPDDRKSTLTFLNNLVRDADENDPGKLRLLVMSQSEPDIKRFLNSPAELLLQKEMNSADIKGFVVQHTQAFEDLGLELDNIEIVQRNICLNAAGQFLYAKLVLENLCASTTLSELREELQDSKFPRGLSEAYERIIQRIQKHLHPKEWNVTQRLLGWMTCAARPLKWHEMQGALAIDFENLTVDFKEKSLSKHVQDFCAPLVSVSNDRISLVHMTAQKFITESEHIDHPLVDCQLAILCIRYLSLPFFEADLAQDYLHESVIDGCFAFSDYATAKWIHHLYRVTEQAHALADRERWEAREADVNILLQAVRDFGQNFHDDLEMSQNDARSRNIDTQLSPAVLELLQLCSIDDARQSLQCLWTHAETSRTAGFHARHNITLQKLQIAMQQMREVLEQVYSDKSLPEIERAKLITYYGDRAYRCSKTTCFFFHQGFKDAYSRNKHVARHDRVFECSEPDCATAEFGFADKKALQAHVLETHPDSDMWKEMFKKIAVKQNNTGEKSKFRCERCDKAFARNAILQAHQRAHAGQKMFECPKCGKAFVRKWDCTRHERTHDNKIRGS